MQQALEPTVTESSCTKSRWTAIYRCFSKLTCNFHRVLIGLKLCILFFSSHLLAIESLSLAAFRCLQVFTFDYRGYGDSSGASRSERDAVDDTLAAHKWLLEAWHHENQQQEDAEIARRRGIVQWAHSLGTGITLRMLADLVDSIDDDAVLLRYLPETVVLESPFNDLLEAAHYYPIGMVSVYSKIFYSSFSFLCKPFPLYWTSVNRRSSLYMY